MIAQRTNVKLFVEMPKFWNDVSTFKIFLLATAIYSEPKLIETPNRFRLRLSREKLKDRF